MAGIYLHIPFCKKICNYCDFYKSAVTSLIPEYLQAVEKELEARVSYLNHEEVQTLYLGGGTPSLLSAEQMKGLFDQIYKQFEISRDCEITLEANPDDITEEYLRELKSVTPVNRLSIGIQSFRDQDLVLLNRRHNVKQALDGIQNALKAGFDNLNIDLIYGIPGMNTVDWEDNLRMAFSQGTKHLSAYCLTVESGTILSKMVLKGKIALAPEEDILDQFAILNAMAEEQGFIHYEISNLARPGYFSKHNSNYWSQEKYLGVGPSAHSYNQSSRQWNVSSVNKYIEAIQKQEPFFEREELDGTSRYNEYVMLSLRTKAGADTNLIAKTFGNDLKKEFCERAQSYIVSGHMVSDGLVFRMTHEGWMVSDRIISELMKDRE
jgi:oxygen-independent coproporphyrinogen III oxidase